MLMPRELSLSVNASDVNRPPWPVLNISGVLNLASACSSASTQKEAAPKKMRKKDIMLQTPAAVMQKK